MTFPPEAIVGVRFVTVVGDVEGPLCRAYIIAVVENCGGVDIIGDGQIMVSGCSWPA